MGKRIEFPTAERQAWRNMVHRCHNPRHPAFARYGGRGITVCDRWRNDFMQFLSDMRPRPPGHSLDRIDNDAGYTPENCRWAIRSVQQRNRAMVLRARGSVQIRDRWRAQIMINGRQIVLGHFKTKAEANRVYRQAAVQAIVTTEILTATLGPRASNDTWANSGSAEASGALAQISLDKPREERPTHGEALAPKE